MTVILHEMIRNSESDICGCCICTKVKQNLNKWGQMTLMLFYENNTFLHKTLKMSA